VASTTVAQIMNALQDKADVLEFKEGRPLKLQKAIDRMRTPRLFSRPFKGDGSPFIVPVPTPKPKGRALKHGDVVATAMIVKIRVEGQSDAERVRKTLVATLGDRLIGGALEVRLRFHPSKPPRRARRRR